MIFLSISVAAFKLKIYEVILAYLMRDWKILHAKIKLQNYFLIATFILF